MDLLQVYRDYLAYLATFENQSIALSFSDWLSSNSISATISDVIDYILALDPLPSDITVDIFVYNPIHPTDPGFNILTPLPYAAPHLGAYNVDLSDIISGDLSFVSNSGSIFVADPYHFFVLLPDLITSYFFPLFSFGQNRAYPHLFRYSITSLFFSVPPPNDPSLNYISPIFSSPTELSGSAYDYTLVYIYPTQATLCDCCCCLESSGENMADCADLVNAVTAIKDELVTIKEKLTSVDTQYNTIVDQQTKIASYIAAVATILNFRLPHRDFTVESMRNLQESIGLAGDTVSQRLAGVIEALIGVPAPASNVPDTPITDSGLNLDTPPDLGEGGGGGGEGGGGGGEGGGA